MKQYHELLNLVLNQGVNKSDRTGTGTISVFGAQARFNLNDGFPLVTTKRVFFKAIAIELLWFLSGDTNIKFLNDNGVTIWDEWADENGNLGPVYGAQWRRWIGYPDGGDTYYCSRGPLDQIQEVIDRIKANPDCRRLIVSAWNAWDIKDMALAPCHLMFQFYVSDGRLSCHMYQRSADLFLGVPFNIASYAMLTMMVAHVCGLGLGDLIISYGDLHIYNNHLDQVKLQLSREPRPLPTLEILPPEVGNIDDFTYDHFRLSGYNPHPAIKAEVSV